MCKKLWQKLFPPTTTAVAPVSVPKHQSKGSEHKQASKQQDELFKQAKQSKSLRVNKPIQEIKSINKSKNKGKGHGKSEGNSKNN
jgi:hypothetical protein